MTQPNVLIVGAGPTGLALGAELMRFGIDFRIIDKAYRTAEWSQALVIQARTLEQFDRYGIAQTAVAQGTRLNTARIYSDRRQVLELDFGAIRSRYPFVLSLPQTQTEQILSDYLTSNGVEIERSVTLTGLWQEPQRVSCTLTLPDGSAETCDAGFVVGCDGAHSTVRKLIGVPFVGDTVAQSFFLADLAISGDNAPREELRVYLFHGNVLVMVPLDGDVCRLIVARHPEVQEEDEPDLEPTLDDFQEAIDVYSDARLVVRDPIWLTSFRINQCKARKYRDRRVFLAGDASHIHSPVGGQGMNTGVQDAANLAWKIDAVLAQAPVDLLGTYNEERGAVGEALLAITSRGLAAATNSSQAVESLRDLFLSMFGSVELVQNNIRGFVSQTGVNYRHSSIVRDCSGSSAVRAGDRAIDVELNYLGEHSRLSDLAFGPDHVLLAMDCDRPLLEQLRELHLDMIFVALYSVHNDDLARVYGGGGRAHIYALRPDGYIGFRGGRDDLPELCEYCAKLGIGFA